jgi:hypothetical protein
VPTHDEDDTFWKDYQDLTSEERVRFGQAVLKFAEDLDRGGAIRSGLRVSEMDGHPGIWEMTWAPDGRATFRFGSERMPGKRHVIWRHVGTHAIFRNP